MNPVLVLAETWPTIDNGLLDPAGYWVTWKLRRNVRWHDGELFDAGDLLTTWRFATDRQGATRTTRDKFDLVTDIERIDDHTVTIHFSTPNPRWFDVFRGGDGVILPGHLFEPLIGKATNDRDNVNQELPGTGPWTVTAFDAAHHRVRFERFEEYWDHHSSPFDTIEIQFLTGSPETNAALVLQSGDGDYTDGIEAGGSAQLRELEASASAGYLYPLPALGVETLFLNFADPLAQPDGRRSEPETSHPLLADLRVRQAISMAIPRDEIANAYGLFDDPFVHLLPAPEIYLGKSFPAVPDMDRARSLLAEAGVHGGQLRIHTTTQPASRTQAQVIIAAALEELGFTIELRTIDAGVFFSNDATSFDTRGHFYADMQIYTPSIGISPYPLEWAERFRSDRIASSKNGWSEPNTSRYSNSAFDLLHDEAKSEMRRDRQAELWRRMLDILTDDVVAIPLVRRNGVAAVSNRITPADFSPWAVAPSWNLHRWSTGTQ